jgi:single-strand DNA-binding protein
MYNKAIQIGHLTKDPELRYTPQGTPVANFRIAVTTKHKSSDGYKDQTLFIDVVVFGKQAENCSQYLAKGRRVLVEGRLQERRWESEGQQRSKVEIVADTVRFMTSGKGEGTGAASQQHEEAPAEATTELEPF